MATQVPLEDLEKLHVDQRHGPWRFFPVGSIVRTMFGLSSKKQYKLPWIQCNAYTGFWPYPADAIYLPTETTSSSCSIRTRLSRTSTRPLHKRSFAGLSISVRILTIASTLVTQTTSGLTLLDTGPPILQYADLFRCLNLRPSLFRFLTDRPRTFLLPPKPRTIPFFYSIWFNMMAFGEIGIQMEPFGITNVIPISMYVCVWSLILVQIDIEARAKSNDDSVNLFFW